MTVRAMLMTLGQIAFYEEVKQMLIASGYFRDTLTTHFSASFVAVSSFCSGGCDFVGEVVIL